jgi:drug/metabolite transporter (DMT)-like permease
MIELILSMIIWGTVGLFAILSKVSALEIAFYRCLIGSICLGVYLFHGKKSIPFNKSLIKIGLAGIFLVLNWVFLFKSFQVSSITIGNMSYYLQPLILLTLGVLFFKEKLQAYKVALILFALIGVMMTILAKNIPIHNILIGAVFALIAALFYSILTILMRSNKMGFFEVIFVQLVIGLIVLVPFIHFSKLSWLSIIYLIIIGIVHTVIAYYLYYKSIGKVDLTSIAIVSYLDPIIAIGTDILFFNRTLNMIQIIGIMMTFSAIYLVIKPKTKRQSILY